MRAGQTLAPIRNEQESEPPPPLLLLLLLLFPLVSFFFVVVKIFHGDVPDVAPQNHFTIYFIIIKAIIIKMAINRLHDLDDRDHHQCPPFGGPSSDDCLESST